MNQPVAACGGKMNQPDRLFGATTAGAGNAGDGNGDVGMGCGQRPQRHGARHLARYRAKCLQGRVVDVQHLRLGRIGIGDVAAVHHGR